MDDAFFRDLIAHAMRLGAADACVDEVRVICDSDILDSGRVSQVRDISQEATLFVKCAHALTRVALSQDAPLSLETAKKRVEDAVRASILVEAWSCVPGADEIPEMDVDDTYRYVDPFDDDPKALAKHQKKFEAFMNGSVSERAPVLIHEMARMGKISDVSLFAKQVIFRKTQRRITQNDVVMASSGATRFERFIRWHSAWNAASLQLPDYVQIGYGIDPTSQDAAFILDSSNIARGYALTRGSSQKFDRQLHQLILGPWAACVVLHETIHQSPYYLGQTEAVAIDSNRGILQCSTPKSSCSAYAIHPTTPELLSFNEVLPQIESEALYVDAPTFVVRHTDTSIDVAFSVVRSIGNDGHEQPFWPVTLRILPHSFWSKIKIAFGPLCRISLNCMHGEPTFQAPGLVLNISPEVV